MKTRPLAFLLLPLLVSLALWVHGEDLTLAVGARDLFRREGCWQCHAEVPGFPLLAEAQRTGPVLDRATPPRSREWHLAHFYDPRTVTPESTMPSYAARFRTNPRATEVLAFLDRYDTDDGGHQDDGVVTEREYEAHGGEDWPAELALLDSGDGGDGVIGPGDAAPTPPQEWETLVDCLLGEGSGDPIPAASPEVPKPRGSAASIARGEALYLLHCAGCHGSRADGQGPAAPFFGALGPRNFRRGEFRLRSTLPPEPPADEDLFRTIRQGAGPSMPAWPSFSDGQVWDLVEFVKSNHGEYLPRELTVERAGGEVVLSFTLGNEDLFDVSGANLPGGSVIKRAGRWTWWEDRRETPIEDGMTMGEYRFILGREVFAWLPGHEPHPLEIGDAPMPYTEESAAVGARVYAEMQCARCHGEEGRGDGSRALETRGSHGQRVRPADYTRGPVWLKGGSRPRDLVRTFLTGMEGTAMPSFAESFRGLASAAEADAPWHLAHFVLRQAGVAPTK